MLREFVLAVRFPPLILLEVVAHITMLISEGVVVPFLTHLRKTLELSSLEACLVSVFSLPVEAMMFTHQVVNWILRGVNLKDVLNNFNGCFSLEMSSVNLENSVIFDLSIWHLHIGE